SCVSLMAGSPPLWKRLYQDRSCAGVRNERNGLLVWWSEGGSSVFYHFDPMYFLFIAPALALSLWASFRTRSAFNKYSQVRTMRGLTGPQAAKAMLDRAGLYDVKVVPTRGMLTDHYNPADKTLALSEGVYASNSVAAAGVACHEAGHAIQHAEGYKPLWIRSLLVPTANIGSTLGYLVMLFGLMLVYSRSAIGPEVVLFGAGQAPGRGKRDRDAAGARGVRPGVERGGSDLRSGSGLDADDPAVLPVPLRPAGRAAGLSPF